MGIDKIIDMCIYIYLQNSDKWITKEMDKPINSPKIGNSATALPDTRAGLRHALPSGRQFHYPTVSAQLQRGDTRRGRGQSGGRWGWKNMGVSSGKPR